MRIPTIPPKSARIDSETPSDTTCATNHTRDAREIITSGYITTGFTIEPTRNKYYNNDSNESRIQIYNTKIQMIQKIKYVRVRTRYKLD